MKGYNGHRSWNAWNVSLWINNDEGLYRLALECVRRTNNRREAAERFIEAIGGNGQQTPDGASYNITAVIAAMEGMEK